MSSAIPVPIAFSIPTLPFLQHLNKPGTPITDSLLNAFGSKKLSSNRLYIQSTFNGPLTVFIYTMSFSTKRSLPSTNAIPICSAKYECSKYAEL